MEINDYLQVVSRRSRFIGAVALAALVLSIATYVLEPPRYRATATVVIPAPTGTTSLIAGVSQAVNDFDGAISSDAVAAGVASATGVGKGAVKSGLSFDRLASSSVAEVSFEGRTAEEAEVVVREASRQALALLLGAELAPYEQQRTFAEAQLAKAQEDLQAFYQETGIIDANRYFENQERRILDLGNQIGAARSRGDEVEALALEQRLATKQAELARQLADFNRLTAAQQRAQSLATDVESAYTSAKAALDSTQTPDAIAVSEADRVSQVSSLLRSVIPAVVIATGLAIAFVILLELTRGRRSGAEESPGPAEESPGPAEKSPGPAEEAASGSNTDSTSSDPTRRALSAGRQRTPAAAAAQGGAGDRAGTAGAKPASPPKPAGMTSSALSTPSGGGANGPSVKVPEQPKGPTTQKAGPSR